MKFSKKLKAQEILVQTQDTKRYQYLFRKFVDHRIPSLFCGPTGTGKTMYIKNVLQSYDANVYSYNELGFSAQTTAGAVQMIIDGQLVKKGRGKFGPALGHQIIFIDDLNMPEKEEYGA